VEEVGVGNRKHRIGCNVRDMLAFDTEVSSRLKDVWRRVGDGVTIE
jgi:hypothetical protein